MYILIHSSSVLNLFYFIDKSLIAEFSVYVNENVLSETALECTERVIYRNEGHYTAWSFRRRVLFALKAPLADELKFIRKFTIETPKNYQLWQHRQVILQRIGSADIAAKDLEDTSVQLSDDSKSIHCWQYRQWLLKHFNLNSLVETELRFTEALLKEDVFNNSAWNHRFFLLQFSDFYKENKGKCLLTEFENILKFLNESNQENECFWNYLTALIQDSSPEGFLSIERDIVPKLSECIATLENTENYLYLRFLSRFKSINQKDIFDKLKKLHPINRAFWTAMSQK